MKQLILLGALVSLLGCYTIVRTERVTERTLTLEASQEELYLALQEWLFEEDNGLDDNFISTVWFSDKDSGVILTEFAHFLAGEGVQSREGRYKLILKAQANQLDAKVIFSGSVKRVSFLGANAPRISSYDQGVLVEESISEKAALKVIHDTAASIIDAIEEFLTERF